MALIRVNFMAQSLHRTVPLMVCLPTDKVDLAGQTPTGPFKTLYLLHGLLGSEVDWVSGTRIQRWSDERNLAVVMPAGENGFYTDHPWSTDLYSQFIGQELVAFTRRSFPLSTKRHDTFIGGLSMGGYGALINGLRFHETFGAIIMLSAALMTAQALDKATKPAWFAETPAYLKHVYGPDLAAVRQSELNPQVLLPRLLAEQVALPAIYMAIGNDDGLKGVNDEFDAFLTQHQIKHVYETGPGNHGWDFWDRYLLRALDWLPLDTRAAGINSGHIG